MDATLVLDTRERGLAAELADEHFTTAQLDCGDIQICLDGRPWLVLERKTLADLTQSIKDGRYREQKARMLAGRADCKVGYVFEGPWSWDRNDDAIGGLPRLTLQSAALNCMFRDDVIVVFTRNLADTADLVRQIILRVRKGAFQGGAAAAAAGPSSYSQLLTVSAKKRTNVDPRTTFVMQLRQIPGVADKAATAICDVWPTMASLCATATAATIADVRLGTRRVGPTIAARVCAYLGVVMPADSPAPDVPAAAAS